MLASLMQGILTHFVPSVFSFEGVLFYMGLFVKRVFLNPVRLLGFVALVLGVYALWQVDLGASECYAYLPKVVSVVALMAFVLHAMKPYDALTQQFVKSYKTLFGFKKFDESVGLRDEFSQEIRDIINPLGKAVVFIDDLDRCRDEDIFKVMQTVNFLTTVDNLFIVMAVDKQKVVDAIERYYKNSGYVQKEGQSNIADDYIEKIFNITVKIPKVDSQFYKDYKGYEHKYQQDDYKKIMAIRESKLARFMEALFTKYLVAVLAIAWVLFNFGYIKEQVDSGAASLKGLVVQMQKCDSNTTQEINSSKGADAPIMPNAKINEINGTNLEPEKEQPSSEVPEIYKDLPVTIDARIKQKEWYEEPMVWLFALLGVGFVMLLIVIVLKKKEQKRTDVEKIWDYIHTSISLSPRERNIEFNKINFFTTIGNKYYIENVTMGNVYRQMMKFALGFVYTMIFFLVIRGERNENLFTRFKNRIVDAFKYAFDLPIESKKNSVVDDLEMFFKAKYEAKDSRLEVVEFRDSMLL